MNASSTPGQSPDAASSQKSQKSYDSPQKSDRFKLKPRMSSKKRKSMDAEENYREVMDRIPDEQLAPVDFNHEGLRERDQEAYEENLLQQQLRQQASKEKLAEPNLKS